MQVVSAFSTLSPKRRGPSVLSEKRRSCIIVLIQNHKSLVTSVLPRQMHQSYFCHCAPLPLMLMLIIKSPHLKLLGMWSLKKSLVCPMVLGELCMYWASRQEPQVDHTVSVWRRLLARAGQKAVEFWQQWHLCRVTPVVLHLSGIHHDMAGPLCRQCELTMSGC